MVNRQPRNPGDLATYSGNPLISTDLPSYAVDTGQASRALADVAGSLSDTLGRLADSAAAREGQLAGLTEGQQAGAAYLQAQQASAQAGGAAGVGPWEEQAKALIRKEEGFITKPKFDVNKFRVGYSSDTTVTPDGKVVPVTANTVVDQGAAERDLDYRIAQREGLQVRKQLGPAFDALPDSAKAAVTSVGYNYGSLPSEVVAAAKTGDIDQLAAAVGGLSANPGRREREAAIIAASGQPSSSTSPTDGVDTTATSSTGASPAGAPAAQAANTYQAPILQTTPLALRRDNTIRGNAADDAAISAWSWRMQSGLSADLFTAQEQHRDDPAGFAAAAQQIRQKYASGIPQDPETQEVFDKAFAERTQSYQQNIAANHEANLRRDQESSFVDGLSSQQVDLERQAQVLGANPNGDAIVGNQVKTIQNSIDGAIGAGTITPAQGEAAKKQVALTAARGRIQGVYDALPSNDQKQQYALSILDDWKDGKGPLSALPFETVKSMSDTLRRDAQERINGVRSQNKMEAARLGKLIDDDVTSIQTSGQGLDQAKNNMTPDHVEEIVGPEGLAKWQAAREKAGKIYDATNGMSTQTAGDITQRLAIIAPKPGTPGYAENLEVFDAAQKQASSILKERANDPAAAVESSFPYVKDAAAGANPQDPASMQQLVGARLQAQRAIGISELEQAPLTKSEALQLSKQVTAQTDPGQASKAMMDLVKQVETTYGPQANAVLTQVLHEQGVGKEMAAMGAGYFQRLTRGLQPTATDKRQAQVLNETSAANGERPGAFGQVGPGGNPGQPVASGARQSSDQSFYPVPNYLQIQRLQQNPQLAPSFEEKFGPGSSTQILGPKGPVSYDTPQGRVTIAPDGTKVSTPLK